MASPSTLSRQRSPRDKRPKVYHQYEGRSNKLNRFASDSQSIGQTLSGLPTRWHEGTTENPTPQPWFKNDIAGCATVETRSYLQARAVA